MTDQPDAYGDHADPSDHLDHTDHADVEPATDHHLDVSDHSDGADVADHSDGGDGAADAPDPAGAPADEPVGTLERGDDVADPRIAAAVARLDALGDSPPAEHVEVYEDVHRVLQDALADAARGGEQGQQGGPGQ